MGLVKASYSVTYMHVIPLNGLRLQGQYYKAHKAIKKLTMEDDTVLCIMMQMQPFLRHKK